MGTYAPPSLEALRDRIDAWQNEQAKRAQAERRKRPAPRPTRRRTKPGKQTRERLRETTFQHASAATLASPDCTPLQRARIERGWTQPDAARRAGVHANTWWAAEQGHNTSRVVRFKIARALGVEQTQLWP